MEEAVHIPFNSSNERECNKKIKNIVPGPGSYIDINNPQNSAIGKSLLKFREDRSFAESQGVKLGAFGSNQPRFDASWQETKEGPGPGTYEEPKNNMVTKEDVQDPKILN